MLVNSILERFGYSINVMNSSTTTTPDVYYTENVNMSLLFIFSILVVLFSCGVGVGMACAELRKKNQVKSFLPTIPSYQAVLNEKESEGIESGFFPTPHTSSIQTPTPTIDTATYPPGR